MSPLPGTVEASVVTWCSGPVKARKPPALAAPAARLVPASRLAVAVTIPASAAARLRVAFISMALPSDGEWLHPWHVAGSGFVRGMAKCRPDIQGTDGSGPGLAAARAKGHG